MNAAAANALYEAEREGVKQIRGDLSDGAGGACAGMVLWRASRSQSQVMKFDLALDWKDEFGLSPVVDGCSLCDKRSFMLSPGGGLTPIDNEWRLMIHLNDDHGLTFGEIARKLGPDSA
jgi:hypothetical protein